MIRIKLLYLLIWALEKYLKLDTINTQTNTTKEFLANAWRNQGFREYMKKRNTILIGEAAGGAGLQPQPRVKYAEMIGRRVENLNMAALAKKSFELEEAKKREKLSQ